jgi:protein O-mannosyl-transferase
MASGAMAGQRPRWELVAALAVALSAVLLYRPATTFDFVNYDDNTFILENPRVRDGLSWPSVAWAFTATVRSQWHPLTWLSHILDVQLFGLRPAGHHAMGMLLHAANAALLAAALLRLTGAFWRSVWVALLFAVHPLNVETVAWVAQRKSVLSALFWMLGLLAYASYVRRPGPGRYLAVAALFVAGLLAKFMIAPFPFVLLLLDAWPLGRWTLVRGSRPALPPWPLVREKLPLIALVVPFGVATVLGQAAIGTLSGLATFPPWIRVGNALVSYVAYLGKLLWPDPLAVLYPHPGGSLAAGRVVAAALLLAAVTVLAWRGAARRPYLAVGWLWYLGTLVPAIGLVQVGAQGMADRYTYLPMIGIFILLSWGAADVAGRLPRRWPMPALAAVATVALAAQSRVQMQHWRNSISLFAHAVRSTSNNAVMHNNLGAELASHGERGDAIRHFLRALEIDPAYATAHANLARLAEEAGDLDAALAHYARALELGGNMLDPVVLNCQLGHLLLKTGRFAAAADAYREALRLRPGEELARRGLAVALGAAASPSPGAPPE